MNVLQGECFLDGAVTEAIFDSSPITANGQDRGKTILALWLNTLGASTNSVGSEEDPVVRAINGATG